MARSQNDMYANIASAQVDITDGSIIFTELMTGAGLGQGIGILIDKIEYTMSAGVYNDMQTDGDYVSLGWSTSNSLTSVNIDQKGVIHFDQVQYLAIGTPAVGLYVWPRQHEFAPPIIVAAPRIFLWVNSIGVTTGTIKSRLYFRYVELKDREYLEIAESFVLVG